MSNPMTYNDLSPAQLVELAVQRNEGHLAANGALVVETGHRTGRSPMDRYVVDEPSTTEQCVAQNCGYVVFAKSGDLLATVAVKDGKHGHLYGFGS